MKKYRPLREYMREIMEGEDYKNWMLNFHKEFRIKLYEYQAAAALYEKHHKELRERVLRKHNIDIGDIYGRLTS